MVTSTGSPGATDAGLKDRVALKLGVGSGDGSSSTVTTVSPITGSSSSGTCSESETFVTVPVKVYMLGVKGAATVYVTSISPLKTKMSLPSASGVVDGELLTYVKPSGSISVRPPKAP